MTILELISEQKKNLPKAEKQVADFFLNHLEVVETMTITKIAQKSETSTSAVLRFCKSLGYKGFKDFRYAAISFLRSTIRTTKENPFIDSLQQYQDGLNALQSISLETLDDMVNAMIQANHIFTIGLYQSSLPAKLCHYGLINLDKHSFLGTDILDTNHLTNLLKDEDVLIYFSTSADRSNFERTLGGISENMPKYAYLITCNQSPSISDYFKDTIYLPDRTYSKNTVIDSQVYQMILTEIILDMLHRAL